MVRVDDRARGGLDTRTDLETRLWLRLLSLQTDIFNRLNSALQREAGVSLAKFEALVQLDRYRDGLSVGRLSEHLRVTSGNVSALARRMMDENLILKTMSDVDRRSFELRLSPHGAQVFEEASRVHDACLREILAEIGDDDLAQADQMLARLASQAVIN